MDLRIRSEEKNKFDKIIKENNYQIKHYYSREFKANTCIIATKRICFFTNNTTCNIYHVYDYDEERMICEGNWQEKLNIYGNINIVFMSDYHCIFIVYSEKKRQAIIIILNYETDTLFTIENLIYDNVFYTKDYQHLYINYDRSNGKDYVVLKDRNHVISESKNKYILCELFNGKYKFVYIFDEIKIKYYNIYICNDYILHITRCFHDRKDGYISTIKIIGLECSDKNNYIKFIESDKNGNTIILEKEGIEDVNPLLLLYFYSGNGKICICDDCVLFYDPKNDSFIYTFLKNKETGSYNLICKKLIYSETTIDRKKIKQTNWSQSEIKFRLEYNEKREWNEEHNNKYRSDLQFPVNFYYDHGKFVKIIRNIKFDPKTKQLIVYYRNVIKRLYHKFSEIVNPSGYNFFKSLNTCDVYRVNLLSELHTGVLASWSRKNTHLFPKCTRKIIFTILCIELKLRKEERINLPNDLWLNIIDIMLAGVYDSIETELPITDIIDYYNTAF